MESIGEISASAGHRPGFREFSARKERNKGSRKSFNMVAPRGSGTDRPTPCAPFLWEGGELRGVGRQGHPSSQAHAT
jgi:hypothetical protein